MSIVDSDVTENRIQADGSRYVRYEYTFNTGEKVYIGPKRVAAGFNATAEKDSLLSRIADRQIKKEDQALIDQAIAGTVDIVNTAPAHPETDSENTRKTRLWKKLFREVTKSKNLNDARTAVYPIWKFLKFDSGLSAAQIASRLDISTAKLSEIDTRFQAIHDNLSFVDTDSPIEIED